MSLHIVELFKMSEEKTIHDLFVEEVQDIYYAEKLLTKALKKMAKAATNAQLQKGFLQHLTETEGQIERLEQVFQELGMRPKAKTCEAMKGLVEEAAEMMKEDLPPEVMDVALISCAQKVEHYEIASYGTLVALADAMGHDSIAALLQETLDEEKATDNKLTLLATVKINPAAMKGFQTKTEPSEEASILGNFGRNKRERYAEMQRSVNSSTGRKAKSSKPASRAKKAAPRKQAAARTKPVAAKKSVKRVVRA